MIYEDLIPADHLLRRLSAAVDFSFVSELVSDRYLHLACQSPLCTEMPSGGDSQLSPGRMRAKCVPPPTQPQARTVVGHILYHQLQVLTALARLPHRSSLDNLAGPQS